MYISSHIIQLVSSGFKNIRFSERLLTPTECDTNVRERCSLLNYCHSCYHGNNDQTLEAYFREEYEREKNVNALVCVLLAFTLRKMVQVQSHDGGIKNKTLAQVMTLWWKKKLHIGFAVFNHPFVIFNSCLFTLFALWTERPIEVALKQYATSSVTHWFVDYCSEALCLGLRIIR